MRRCLMLWTLCLGASTAWACNCFPPELKAKTAQEALDKAELAALVKVRAVDAAQTATLTVLEAYKGLDAGATFDAVQDTEQCGPVRFVAGEKLLFIAFKPKVTACDRHPADHYMVEEFRKLRRP